MSFERVAENNDAGLYAWSTTDDAPSGWTGYLLPQGAQALDSIPADDAWSDHWGIPIRGVNGGTYVFLEAAPADVDALLDRLLAYIDRLNIVMGNRAYRYLMWVANPDDTADDIVAQQINFVKAERGDGGSVAVLSQLSFRNVSFDAEAGVRLQSDAAAPSISLVPFQTEATIGFTNAIGPPRSFGKINVPMVVGIAGPAPGRLEGAVELKVADVNRRNDLRTMRTGIQYFFDREIDVNPGSTVELEKRLIGRLYPMLDRASTGKTTMRVWLDPTRPLDTSRTSFVFTDGGDGSPVPEFGSFYVTDSGHIVRLTPVAGSGGFALQAERYPVEFIEPQQPQTPTYYFTPMGQFAITKVVPPPGAPADSPVSDNLLCGLGGTETIAIAPSSESYDGDLLTFYPDQRAYAPRFPLPDVDLNLPQAPAVEQELLGPEYTTAWATIERGSAPSGGDAASCADEVPTDPNVYFSQPDGASLFADKGQAARAANGGDEPPALGFYPTKMADLAEPSVDRSFPLTPYAGIHLETGGDILKPWEVPDFESQIVSPTRKQQITAIKREQGVLDLPPASPETADTQKTTSPQGFLVDVSTESASQWVSMLLATNTDQGLQYDLKFSPLDALLQDAFQTNQQFLVVTQPARPWNTGEGTTFENTIAIEGWPFQINVPKQATPGACDNVLIFKFVPGQLSEHIKNPSNWTNASDFNDDVGSGLALVSQWLQDYVSEAREMAAFEASQGLRESYFQQFLDIVDSDTWQGVLALQVDLDLGAFPPELKGLLGGIDLSRFRAHHLGMQVNFVQPQADGELGISGNSSLFGLVYYVDTAYQAQLQNGGSPDRPVAAPPGLYDFKVLTLKVLFENTAVKTFESKLQLTMNEWFGDEVLAIVDPKGLPLQIPSNSIIIDGAYEEHDGHSTFTFSSHSKLLFLLRSNVLGAVEAVQATFSTLTDHGAGAVTDFVRSRFNLTGYMNFRPAAGLDAFSFGSEWAEEQPGERAGLYFSNVYVDLSFPLSAPTERTFAFEIGGISFDEQQSEAREKSLYPNFPLKVAGLLRGTAGETPEKLGYLGMTLPAEASFRGLRGDWYGLNLQLDLGTMGALADEAGLTAHLLFAWSRASGETGETYDVSATIQLPGTGGVGTLFSIQGVLKLSISDIQLLLGETQDGRPAFMLKLSQLALQFLAFKFPPSGNTVFFLFGNPEKGSDQHTLGWYAAYNKEKKPLPASAADLSGHRADPVFVTPPAALRRDAASRGIQLLEPPADDEEAD